MRSGDSKPCSLTTKFRSTVTDRFSQPFFDKNVAVTQQKRGAEGAPFVFFSELCASSLGSDRPEPPDGGSPPSSGESSRSDHTSHARALRVAHGASNSPPDCSSRDARSLRASDSCRNAPPAADTHTPAQPVRSTHRQKTENHRALPRPMPPYQKTNSR